MYNQQTNKIRPPQVDDDVDSFMSERQMIAPKSPPMPKAAQPDDDVDSFMSKRQAAPKTAAPAPSFSDTNPTAPIIERTPKGTPTYDEWRKSGSTEVPDTFRPDYSHWTNAEMPDKAGNMRSFPARELDPGPKDGAEQVDTWFDATKPYSSETMSYKPKGVAPKPRVVDPRARQAAQISRQINQQRDEATRLFKQADATPMERMGGNFSNTEALRAQAEGKLASANELARRAQKTHGDLLEVGFGKDADPNSRREWAYAKPKAPKAMEESDALAIQAGNNRRFADPNGLNQALNVTPEAKARFDHQRKIEGIQQSSYPGLDPVARLGSRVWQGVNGESAANMAEAYPPVIPGEEHINRIAQLGVKGAGQLVRGGATALPYTFPVVDMMSSGLTGKPLRAYTEGLGRLMEDAISRGAETILPENPANQSFLAKIERGLGSMIPAIGGALATGGGSLAAGALGALTNLGQVADERDQSKVPISDFRRVSSDALAIATGMTEALGIGKLLNRVGLSTPLAHRLAQMIEEGGQEYAQDYLNDINAKLVAAYDPQRQINDPLAAKRLEAAAIGAILGAGGEVADYAGGKVNDRIATPAIRAESAPMQGIQPTTLGPTQITPLSRATAAAQPATTIPAIDQTVPRNAVEPSVPPVAAESQSSAFPKLPEVEGVNSREASLFGLKSPVETRVNKDLEVVDGYLKSQSKADRDLGKRMLRQSLAEVQKSEGYQAELGLPDDAPKPYTAVRQAIEDRLKPAAKVAEQVAPVPESSAAQPGNTGQRLIEQTRQKADTAIGEGRYDDAVSELKAHQQALKDAKTAARKSPGMRTQIERQIGQVGNQIGEVRRMAREARKQANAPTTGLPKTPTFSQQKAPQAQAEQADTRNISAPLLRPEAVQNSEGGIPQMPEQTFSGRLDQGIRKQDAQKPSAPAKRLISRIQELGGISNRYGGELQGVKDAQRIGVVRNKATMSPDILARQLQSEGYDIDPENLDTLWRAIDRDISTKNERPANTADLNQRLKDEEADYYAQQEEVANEPTKSFDQIDEEVQVEFKPDTADLREVREFGRREAVEPEYTQEPPEQRETGRRITPFRPPAPARPQGVGNRPMTIDVAGTRTPSAMSAEFPRARRAMVRAGREVEARLEMGQEKGQYGNFANAMFKSNSPDVLHGQDSFFHDPDVKGKLGLTRDAEMADVRKELKTQLARSLGVTVDEVSLSHIKPEVWRAWARQKGLGRTAMQKLEAGINRAEGKERAIKTNAAVNAEESQRGKESVRQPEGKASEPAPIKTGDSVTWQRGDKVEWDARGIKRNGTITSVKDGRAVVDLGFDITETVPVGRLTATAPKIRERKTTGFFSQLERVIEQKMPAKASAAQVRAIIENPQSGVKADEVKWTGLDDYLRGKETVTKSEVQEFLKANQVEVQEVTHGQPIGDMPQGWTIQQEGSDQWAARTETGAKVGSWPTEEAARKWVKDRMEKPATKFGQYVLPGAKEGSYRELLLTLPEAPMTYNEGFYVRYPDGSLRESFDNKADADRKAREVGGTVEPYKYEKGKAKQSYKSSHFDEPNILAHLRFNERTDSDGKRVMHVEEIQSDWHQEGRKKGYATKPRYTVYSATGARVLKEGGRETAVYENKSDADAYAAKHDGWYVKETEGVGVPDAPFKKNWHELAFKRALRYAAENGYDKMTWTTGEQQADRFDLSKQVDSISALRNSDGSYEILAMRTDGEGYINVAGGGNKIAEDKIEDYIGKDLARKIVDQPSGEHDYSGIDLKVGGEGMKGFYDSILLAFANKYGRKWGVKVGEAKVDVSQGKPTEYEDFAAWKKAKDEGKTETVHAISITPAMRESVMQGQPLFRKGDAVPFTGRYTVKDLAENATAEYRPARNRPGTVYLNDWGHALLADTIVQVYGEKHSGVSGDLTISANTARNLADEMRGRASGEFASIAKTLETAADDADANGRDVAIVTHRPGQAISRTKTNVRHETTHAAQSAIDDAVTGAATDLWLDRQPKAKRVREELAARGYTPDTHGYEAVAFTASGEFDALGLSLNEAEGLLDSYYRATVRKYGASALEKFGAIDPKLQPTLERAKDEAGIRRTTAERSTENIGRSDRGATIRARREGQGNPGGDEGTASGRQGRAAETPQVSRKTREDVENSPEFKRWFGNSKVVDEKGKPLVVYHGTTESFDAFDDAAPGTRGTMASSFFGHFFSPDAAEASKYATDITDKKEGANVVPVYLSIKDPYTLQGVDHWNYMTDTRKAQSFRKMLEGNGYDGIIIRSAAGDEYVAFSRNQIKSATGNRGTFDPASPKINERKEKRSSFGSLENEPKGQVLASGFNVQNLFNRKPKEAKTERPIPLPKDFDAQTWARKTYTDAIVNAMSPADRAKYDAAKGEKAKIAAMLGAKVDQKVKDAAFDAIDKGVTAAKKGDGSGLYDAMVESAKLSAKKPPQGKFDRAKYEASNLVSLPRAVMASADISAPLRQGAILTLPPSQWGKAAKATVRMFQSFSTKQYDKISKEINLHPDGQAARDAGLYLSTDKTGIGKKEEDFISNWSDKIPIVKHSEQAYKAYLDSLRMDTFARYKKSIDKSKGLSGEQKATAYKAAADWINVATGRGTLGKTFESAMPVLSKVMFAPRYAASRIQVLNPYTYGQNLKTPAGRAVLKGQMSDLVQFSGAVASVLALALANGATVGFDPDDPDFLKIKVGNTRYDFLAGLQQPMRLFWRMGNAVKEKITGEKSKSRQNAIDIASRYGRSKLAPVPSFFLDALTGKTFTGEDFNAKKGVIDRVTPLMWKDYYDAYQKEGFSGASKILPGLVGIGVQNYGERTGALKPTKFSSSAEEKGLKYDFLRQRKGEPEAIYKQRVQRVEGWMSTYGDKLINHPGYKALPEAEQKQAIESLRRRIGAQQNLVRPNVRSLEPGAVLLGVKKAAAQRPKREAKQLYTPQLY